MPKLKKKKIEDESPVEETEKKDEKNVAVEDRDFSELIKQVQSEYKLAFGFIKPKIDEWALRLKHNDNSTSKPRNPLSPQRYVLDRIKLITNSYGQTKQQQP